jgi:hypothetical protein
MIKWTDGRGRFKERFDGECRIEKSNLLEPCIWLARGPFGMHLTREMAAELASVFQVFAETGELRER